MAQELIANYGGASFAKNGVSFQQPTKKVQMDVTGDRACRHVQVIGTTEEDIQKAELASIGYFYFENLDATNYVEIGALTGDYFLKLPPGMFAEGYADLTTLFAKANGSPVKLQVFLVKH